MYFNWTLVAGGAMSCSLLMRMTLSPAGLRSIVDCYVLYKLTVTSVMLFSITEVDIRDITR